MKLNLGCGPHVMEGWENIDEYPYKGVKVYDLRQSLPYKTDSVDFIFTEHFFEHITREQGLGLLKECRRILRPKGVIRIVTPDLKHVAKLYLAGKIDDWKGCWEPFTPAQFMNEAMRSWGHQFVYDADELKKIVHEAGFGLCIKRQWRQSGWTELSNLEVRPFNGELIFEALREQT